MDKKVLIWLDDIRDPLQDDWLNFSPIGRDVDVIWVKSYYGFTRWIKKHGLPDGICFDHDLGDNFTGYTLAKAIERYAYYGLISRIKWNIHSANPVGRNNIKLAMNSAERFWENK